MLLGLKMEGVHHQGIQAASRSKKKPDNGLLELPEETGLLFILACF